MRLIITLDKGMHSLRSNMNIGIVASKSEAIGRVTIVTIEGMLGNFAMIGATAAGTSELIQNGKTGLLYRPGDVADLVKKTDRLASTTIFRHDLADEGEKFSEENFTNGKYANKTGGLINY